MEDELREKAEDRAIRKVLKTLEDAAAAPAAKSLQWCPTLCDTIDGKPILAGILQARTLEWVAISFSCA